MRPGPRKSLPASPCLPAFFFLACVAAGAPVLAGDHEGGTLADVPDAAAIARRFAEVRRGDLGLDANATFALRAVRRGLSGTFVRLSPVVNGTQLSRSDVVVHLASDGVVRLVLPFDRRPDVEMSSRVAVGNGVAARAHPAIASATGVTGVARVFSPNPIVTLRDPTLRLGDVPPPEAYRVVALPDLDPAVDGRFHLSGPYARAIAGSSSVLPPAEASPSFLYSLTDNPEGLVYATAYHHIDAIQRFIQALGFTDVNNRRTDFGAIAGASYDAQTGIMSIAGIAGDGEFIAHEYGHAVQDNQCPGCFPVIPVSEGFADFFAVAYFLDQSGGFQDACVAEWSATLRPDQSPCERRIDTAKRYPDDVAAGSPHASGQIWSGALWDILLALGGGPAPTLAARDVAVQLLLESNFLLPPAPSFFENARAVVDADELLFGGAHRALLESAFAARGIWNPAPGPLISGGGRPETDCDAGFSYANPENAQGATASRQVCVDGDASCDADAVEGQCTFRIATCFGQRGLLQCRPAELQAFTLRSPRRDDRSPLHRAVARAVLTSVERAPGARRLLEHPETIVFFPIALQPGACAPPADVVVPLRGSSGRFRRRSVTLRTETVVTREGLLDRDGLKLTCAPAS